MEKGYNDKSDKNNRKLFKTISLYPGNKPLLNEKSQ